MTFNKGQTLAPSYVKCNRTPSSREVQAAELAAALAKFKGKPEKVPGFQGVKPLPPRTEWRDPEARLTRREYGVNTSLARAIQRQRDLERIGQMEIGE